MKGASCRAQAELWGGLPGWGCGAGGSVPFTCCLAAFPRARAGEPTVEERACPVPDVAASLHPLWCDRPCGGGECLSLSSELLAVILGPAPAVGP